MSAQHGKTLKLISKRLKITKRGTILRRFMQLGHGKANESGNITRRKRQWSDVTQHPLVQRAVKRMHYGR